MSEVEQLNVYEIMNTLTLDENGYCKKIVDYDARTYIDDAIWMVSCYNVDWLKDNLLYEQLKIERDMRMHLSDMLEYYALFYYIRATGKSTIPITLWDDLITITSDSETKKFLDIKIPINEFIKEYAQ